MRQVLELELFSTGELVETAADVMVELAGRPVPESAAKCLDLVGLLGSGLDVGESAMAALLLAADRAGEALAQRYAGTSGYLRVVLGMRQGRANERITVARQLPRLPKVDKLLAAGELSFGFASTICEAVVHLSDVDCVAAEEILLGAVAEGVTAPQVAKLGERIVETIAEREGREREPEDGRRGERSWLKLSRSLGGSSFVKGRFTPELTALFVDRLGPLTRPSGPDDIRSADERWADALEVLLSEGGVRWNAMVTIRLEQTAAEATGRTADATAVARTADGTADGTADARMTDGAADAKDADGTVGDGTAGSTDADGTAGDVAGGVECGVTPAAGLSGDGARRAVHEEAAGESAGGRVARRVPVWPLEELGEGWRGSARLADGTPIPMWRARTIAINAGISTLVLGAVGVPLYLGGKVRFATAGQRRALEALYDTCAFSECDIPVRFCEIDHVANFCEYQLTDVDLLAPCCGFHNRLKYTNPGQVSASRDARGRWVYKINRLRRVFRRGVAGGDAGGDGEPRGP
jgi:Domain of unknown function (DUF222)